MVSRVSGAYYAEGSVVGSKGPLEVVPETIALAVLHILIIGGRVVLTCVGAGGRGLELKGVGQVDGRSDGIVLLILLPLSEVESWGQGLTYFHLSALGSSATP